MKYVLAAAALLVISGLLLVMRSGSISSSNALEPVANAPAASQLQTPRTPPQGHKEYRTDKYHFSLFYPEYLSVSEFDEGAGASTITFQSVEKAEGFQVFIVPYGEPQITDEQFKKDNPSGVMKGLQDITIDGATAASFYSRSDSLGETAEVWLLHDGYLYEVTTPKPLAEWLSDIMCRSLDLI
jgi:hypothetical protein